MIFKTTMWILCLTFVATIYNVVSAYDALGNVDIQDRFEEIGLLHDGEVALADRPLPPRKPAVIQEFASR